MGTSGRLKLLTSVTSFGVITGICLLIGYYLFRKQKKTSSDLNSENPTPSKSQKEQFDKTFHDKSDFHKHEQHEDEEENVVADADADAANDDGQTQITLEKNDYKKTCRQMSGDAEKTGAKSEKIKISNDEAKLTETVICLDDVNETMNESEKHNNDIQTEYVQNVHASQDGDLQFKKNKTSADDVHTKTKELPAAAAADGHLMIKNQQYSKLSSEITPGKATDGSAESVQNMLHNLAKRPILKLDEKKMEESEKHLLNGISRENKEELKAEMKRSLESAVAAEDENSGSPPSYERKETENGELTRRSKTEEVKSLINNTEELRNDQSTTTTISAGIKSETEKKVGLDKAKEEKKFLQPLTPPPAVRISSRRQKDRMTSELVETEMRLGERNQWPSSPSAKHHEVTDNVEVDTSSQKVLWTTTNKESPIQSPWSSMSHQSSEEEFLSGRKIQFEDNFVNTSASAAADTGQRHDDVMTTDENSQRLKFREDVPECVLEREPLISDEDEDSADLIFKKLEPRIEKKTEEMDSNGTAGLNSNEESKKLCEINENCVSSLIELTKESNVAVHLASLKALVNLSWTTEKHFEYAPIIGQIFSDLDNHDSSLKLETLRILANLSRNPAMVPHLLSAKAPSSLLKLLLPEEDEESLIVWLTILDDILWTSREMCLTYSSLPTEFRAASPETVYTGLYGLKNSRILKSRIFILSRHKSQQVTYLASRIYSCLTA